MLASMSQSCLLLVLSTFIFLPVAVCLGPSGPDGSDGSTVLDPFGYTDTGITYLNLTNITSPDPNEVLYATPLGITSSLPWWTPFPAAALDLIIAVKSITVDWRTNFGENSPDTWSKSLDTREKAKVAFQALEALYMLIQVFAGFAYLGQYSWRRQFLRYGGPTAYALVFAAAVRLWNKLAFLSRVAQVTAWVLALLALLLFVLLHLPDLGTGPSYQLWAPGCIPWDNVTETDWSCANASDLALGSYSGTLIPMQVDWAYAGGIGALLLFTAYRHVKYLITKRGLHFRQRIAGAYPSAKVITRENVFSLSDHVATGSLTSVLLLFVLTMTILAFYIDVMPADDDDVRGEFTVCPSLPNSSLAQLVFSSDGYLNDSRCWAVSVDLPSVIPDVPTAVRLDKANIARLIFNF